MEYGVVLPDDAPRTDLSELDDIPVDLDVRSIGDALGLENMRINVWFFDPGDEIGYHAHSEQEECYYILKGDFSLKLGKSGDTELVEAGPGTFFAAGPGIGHGHRYVGDDEGIVLAIGAPAEDDPGLDPHQLD